MSLLTVKGLAKNYGSLAALDGLDLTVEAGQIFGLLGPNGSGKTTLLAILLDVIHPSGGSFSWFEAPEARTSATASARCWRHPISIPI